MEYCGGCGTQLARGLDRGRFCAACGHENPGNARYPLYAEGAAGTAAGPEAAGPAAASRAIPVAATAVAMPVVDPTSVRLEPVRPPAPATPTGGAATSTPTAWRVTLLAALAAMLVLVLLGLVLLLL